MNGLVLGKFLPPHAGHAYLCRFAEAYCDDLTIVVGSLARESIPGILRFQWMQELFPRCRVVHLDEELPQTPEEHPDFWALWRAALRRVAPPPEVVFASETYGWRLASELGARFVPADPGRSLHPVSGTLVREDPWKHWALLTPPVQRHLRLRVAIHGAESTGKTTLAAALAARLGTAWVPEYARTLLEAQEGRLTYDDLDIIARGQAASQAALEAAAGPVLVYDTDAAATAVWSEVLFGRVSATVRDAAAAATADLTLLTDPSVPYEADLVRYRPADDRPAFTTQLREALTARGRRVVMVQGDLEARLETALGEIERLRPRNL